MTDTNEPTTERKPDEQPFEDQANRDVEGPSLTLESLAERQRELLATEDPTKPYWFGYDLKNETEAGVEPDVLNNHLFIAGKTGDGRTTLLVNYFHQIMQRGHGGMFFDLKGDDAEDVAQLLPEHREDDLVYLEISEDSDYEMGFNFLEIPLTDPDPERQAFDSAVSALADDFEALLAQSSDRGSWGSRMSRITRAVVRGLAEYQVRSDEDKSVTMLDMTFLLANEEDQQLIREVIGKERIEWLQQAAHVTDEYSEDDLEPLVRRLWEWIFSRTVRSAVSHPSATISIDEIVREGKILVVENNSSGEMTKRVIATALIRRIWLAIREQTNHDDEPDPSQFFAVCDGFDDIANERSNIQNILREARSFGLSLAFAARHLDTGGGDNGIPEDTQMAIRGNCNTFLTFNPGDRKDADDIARQHSKNIDGEAITELPRYRIYMRTHDEGGDRTDSYKVQTFPPAPEILDDEIVRSKAETEALIEQSKQRYGQPKQTDENRHRDTTSEGNQ